MPIKYTAGQSAGTPFELGETRDVVVTGEALAPSTGYEDDTVTYTATVKDNLDNALPATFVASLQFAGEDVVTDVAFGAAVYNQTTKLLTLEFTVPAGTPGSKTVKLMWAEQTI